MAVPPGVDFGKAVVSGLLARSAHLDPEALARVQIYVNTRRMQRRLREVFDQGTHRLLPRIGLVTDLVADPSLPDLPPAVAPLKRRLDLSQLVAGLLDQAPELAPRAAIFDLSDSLARILDEMNGEGLTAAAFERVRTEGLSDHWLRSMHFLRLVSHYLEQSDQAPDVEARQRQVVEALAQRWQTNPPDHPILLAGSTGSRGATRLFMAAVARLPQGAVILPGFDPNLPDSVWQTMADRLRSEDHPQYRFWRVMQEVGFSPPDIMTWVPDEPVAPARNRVISLALRPAPITDQWRDEGPGLGDLVAAMRAVTLVEAPGPKVEAEVIALRLRAAVAEGKSAALISPDRTLTRQVTAALDRWHLLPDDSAGQPLHLSPPGRFLRQVAALFGRKTDGEALLSLLKHPLCHSAGDRGPHLRRARELELELRRSSLAHPDAALLADWAGRTGATDPDRIGWAEWLARLLTGLDDTRDIPLTQHVERHLALTEALAAGPAAMASGSLWEESAGRTSKAVMADLAHHAGAGGILSAAEYSGFLNSYLSGFEVRNPDRGHPLVKIWGTLEARVQGTDLVILAGLNDGTWPGLPPVDPWLNRQMRDDMGLPLPERSIGLSAHDFQQAVAGAEVWITRAIRSNEAQTVASRWIYRLTNLLEGLPDQGGTAALAAMRERGRVWIDRAQSLSARPDPVPRARRPSPRPPVSARPRELSVTQLERLVRDPYEIYVRKVLGIEKLDPLVPEPDAALRGDLLHRILERFVRDGGDPASPTARDGLLEITDEVLASMSAWPLMQRLWRARMAEAADGFLASEVERRALGTPDAFETWGKISLSGLDFAVKGKADRIDLCPDGSALIYDYKTGTPPGKNTIGVFDLQLLFEAAMAERGAFAAIGPRRVKGATYVAVGSGKDSVVPLGQFPPDKVWADLHDLVAKWMQKDRGYSSRIAMQKVTDEGRFDHLARFGEWESSDDIAPEDVE